MKHNNYEVKHSKSRFITNDNKKYCNFEPPEFSRRDIKKPP